MQVETLEGGNSISMRPSRLLQPMYLLALLALAQPMMAQVPTKAPSPPTTQPPASAPKPLPDPARWEKRIQVFEEADKKAPPAPNSIVFYGSSSIGNWKTLREDFPNLPTLNRGFGGSNIPEAVYYADRMVVAYHPRAIVFYSGDNDIAQGRTPQQVRDDFAAFVTKVRAGGVTDAPIFFIAIKPSVARWKMRDKIMETNRLIKEWSGAQPGGKVIFVDIYGAMLSPDGQPRPELYVKDGLHMTREGYNIWVAAVKPVLEAALTSATPAPAVTAPTAP